MRNARRLSSIFFLTSFLGSLVAPSITWGVGTFNPNYILSDEELQNTSSMSTRDIQSFLDTHGGYISGLTTVDVSGTPRTAAEIIYQAANDYLINPKYLLVKLQKEQSLITDVDPTQKQLDWATGYGVCDSCSMNAPSLQRFKGFGTQVDKAAGIMRWYYDNLEKEGWIKRANRDYIIDNNVVVPATLATAFLYTYTPHIHGNQNFWTLWQRWFEQNHPSGTLLKAPNNDIVFLIQGQQKRPITSMTALVTRFDPKMIITVPESELNGYELGAAIRLPNYSVLRQGDMYYLLDDDTLRPFASADVVKSLGYNPDEIVDVTAEDIAGLKSGSVLTANTTAPFGRVLRVKENKQLYFLKENIFYPMSDPRIAANRFPQLSIEDVSVTVLAPYEQGPLLRFKDGTLLAVELDNKVYVVEDGQRRHITSEDVFVGLGYSWKNILWIDEITASLHPLGESLSVQKNIQVAEVITSPNTVPGSTPVQNGPFIGEAFETPMKSYLVSDAAGTILAGKNIDTSLSPASLVKVMTAYQVLKDDVSISTNIAFDPKKHGVDSAFRIAPGEKIRNERLLYALLVSSLNTPARILTSQTNVSESAFIAQMNATAKTWGLKKTSFDDITGISSENTTTAREFLLLYRQVTKDATLRDILGMKSYTYTEVVDRDGQPNHSDTHSNELTADTTLPYMILDSKTGYLNSAGAHLIMHIKSKKDGKEFFVLALGNPNSKDRFSEPARFTKWVINTF